MLGRVGTNAYVIGEKGLRCAKHTQIRMACAWQGWQLVTALAAIKKPGTMAGLDGWMMCEVCLSVRTWLALRPRRHLATALRAGAELGGPTAALQRPAPLVLADDIGVGGCGESGGDLGAGHLNPL